MTDPDPLERLLPAPLERLRIAPLLDDIAAQAETADRTRDVDRGVIEALRGSDFMRMSATSEIGGLGTSMLAMARELEAVAARCPSLAWCLWNHLVVFHLFVGALGPEQDALLGEITRNGEWVCFPAGAHSGVHGKLARSGDTGSGNTGDQPDAQAGATSEPDIAVINGKGTWGTGARYADWAGVVFAVAGDDGEPVRPLDLRFTVLRLDTPGVKVEATWDGAALRASSTDEVHYTDVVVPLDRCVAWYGANRAESLRTIPVVNHRYREDWVGISDLFLGWIALGVVREALREMAQATRTRRVLMGAAMVERQAVQLNIGRAASLAAAAQAALTAATEELDRRITDAVVPDEADYLRQMAVSSMATNQLTEAMNLLLRSQGGTALRQGGTFERRHRDFATMPLHINVHEDRVTHQVGRNLLGLDPFPF